MSTVIEVFLKDCLTKSFPSPPGALWEAGQSTCLLQGEGAAMFLLQPPSLLGCGLLLGPLTLQRPGSPHPRATQAAGTGRGTSGEESRALAGQRASVGETGSVHADAHATLTAAAANS